MPDYWKIMSDGFKDGKLLAITPDNLRKDIGATRRFTDVELEHYAYQVVDGRLKRVLDQEPLRTSTYSSHEKIGIAAFVIGLDGTIYIFNHLNKTDKVAHSSFVGKFAKGAGEIMVADGKITFLHAHSGHFRPNAMNIFQVASHFQNLAALAPAAKVGFVSDPFAGTGVAAPDTAMGVQYACLRDEDERRFLEGADMQINGYRQQIRQLRASLTEEHLPPYRQAQIERLTADLATMSEQLGLMETQESMKGFVETYRGMVASKSKEVTAAGTLSFEDYKAEINRGIRKFEGEIEDALSLIEALRSKVETINIVYLAEQFITTVRTHQATLRSRLVPAFLNPAYA